MEKKVTIKFQDLLLLCVWIVGAFWMTSKCVKMGKPLLSFCINEHYSYWVFVLVGYVFQAFLLALAFYGLLSAFYVPSTIAPGSKISRLSKKILSNIGYVVMAVTLIVAIVFFVRDMQGEAWGWWFLAVPIDIVVLVLLEGLVYVLLVPTGFADKLDIGLDMPNVKKDLRSYAIDAVICSGILAAIAFIVGSVHFCMIHYADVIAIIVLILIIAIPLAIWLGKRIITAFVQ